MLLVVEGDGLVAKICDFGSAKWRIALASTSTGNKGSTTAWAAPETYRSKGSPGVFTEASDVWSFGMLVFEIVFLKVGGSPLTSQRERERERDLLVLICLKCPDYRFCMKANILLMKKVHIFLLVCVFSCVCSHHTKATATPT